MRNDGIHMPELSEPTLDELERLAEAIGERADGFELDMPDGSVARGYRAPGIQALAQAMRRFGRVTVVAPDHNHSGASNSLTLNRPLTLTEKILFTHLYHPESLREFKRGVDYIELRRTAPARMTSAARWPSFSSSPRARNASPCPQRSSATTSFRPTSAPFPTSRSPKRATSKRTSSCVTSPAATALTSGLPAPASAIRSSWKTTTSRVA